MLKLLFLAIWHTIVAPRSASSEARNALQKTRNKVHYHEDQAAYHKGMVTYYRDSVKLMEKHIEGSDELDHG